MTAHQLISSVIRIREEAVNGVVKFTEKGPHSRKFVSVESVETA